MLLGSMRSDRAGRRAPRRPRRPRGSEGREAPCGPLVTEDQPLEDRPRVGSRPQRGLGQSTRRIHAAVRVPPNASFQFNAAHRRFAREHVGANRPRRRRRAEGGDWGVEERRALRSRRP